MAITFFRMCPSAALVLWVAGLSCLPGCRPQTAQQPETAEPPTTAAQPAEALPISGMWISQAYADELQRHGSPRKAQEGSEEVLLVLPDSLSGRAAMHYNFHELLPDLVIRKTADGYLLGDPAAQQSPGPAYLVKSAGDRQITVNGKPFFRLDIAQSGNPPRVLEKLLFDGMYLIPGGQRVTFDPKGHVRGIDPYTLYQPRLDYFDEGLQVDQIGLGKTPDDLEWFGFAFKKGKLTIYNLRCKTRDKASDRCVEVAFGDVRYTMERTSGVE